MTSYHITVFDFLILPTTVPVKENLPQCFLFNLLKLATDEIHSISFCSVSSLGPCHCRMNCFNSYYTFAFSICLCWIQSRFMEIMKTPTGTFSAPVNWRIYVTHSILSFENISVIAKAVSARFIYKIIAGIIPQLVLKMLPLILSV